MPWATPTRWTQSDFGDRGALDLAVGPVRGVRWWSVMDSGRLVGAFNGTWAAGENVAECRAQPAMTWRLASAQLQVMATLGGRSLMVNVEHAYEPPMHEAADPHCTCGFYAFWRPEPLPLYEQYPVIGVIEGYGRTVIGNRGFRCERARILGLHRPRRYGDAASAITEAWAHQLGGSLDQRLAQRYDVPTYQSIRELLDRHPPTTDYAFAPGPAADS